jgi:hypothetical protein
MALIIHGRDKINNPGKTIHCNRYSPQSSSLSPEAGTIGQEWPQCQQPHKPELKKKLSRHGTSIKTFKYITLFESVLS